MELIKAKMDFLLSYREAVVESYDNRGKGYGIKIITSIL
jgi:hypothetical protein